MAGRKAYPSAIISASLHPESERLPFSSSSEVLVPIWVPVPSPAFQDPMVNFESISRDDQNGDEEDYELQPSAKKRRLSAHQVQFLERSFDDDNKLEPERKVQLAKELGLQPRQVAIWFQNRRARFKSKQLEKEYGELKDSYDKLKAEWDCLVKEKGQLKEELNSLKEKLLMREKGKEKQSSSEPLEPVNSRTTISQDRKPNMNIAELLLDRNAASRCKQEEASSGSRSSGVLDSDSPYNITDSSHPALLLEPANSSHAFEPDCSDFSQDEGDNLDFPNLENGYRAGSTSSCGFGFTAELDQQLWSWPY